MVGATYAAIGVFLDQGNAGWPQTPFGDCVAGPATRAAAHRARARGSAVRFIPAAWLVSRDLEIRSNGPGLLTNVERTILLRHFGLNQSSRFVCGSA